MLVDPICWNKARHLRIRRSLSGPEAYSIRLVAQETKPLARNHKTCSRFFSKSQLRSASVKTLTPVTVGLSDSRAALLRMKMLVPFRF
jgi:hypothetical protein